jgi:predicted trehalose synthase
VTAPTTCDPSWLAEQRWYGAAHRTLRALRVVAAERLGPDLEWQVVEACFADGDGVDGEAGGEADPAGPVAAPPVAFYQLFWDPVRAVEAVDRPDAMRWLFPHLPVRAVRALGGEQSNTSVVVEPGPVIVKVLRRLSGEANPDADVVRRLWDHGFRGVPEPLGERRQRIDVESLHQGLVDVAVARRFLPGSTDGWDLALAAHDDFSGRAAQLGRLTGQLHCALAEALGRHRFDGVSLARHMSEHARRVLGDDAPLDAFDRLADAGVEPAIRVHGDYHLGQVLLHGEDWYVLDFEGEPVRPVAERTAPASPLRDVAGMLRSFAYAAVVAEHRTGWEQACRDAFLGAYFAAPGVAELLPDNPALVLDAFEMDKAIYEVAYERANRPDWVAIPLAAVDRLSGRSSPRP